MPGANARPIRPRRCCRWKRRPPRGTPGLRCRIGTGPVRRTEKKHQSPQLPVTGRTTGASAPVLPRPAPFGARGALFTQSPALRIATGPRWRTIGTTRSQLIEFLFLFGREYLAEFLANIGIQFVKLLALLFGQPQTLANERRKDRRWTGMSGTGATGAAWIASRFVAVGATSLGSATFGSAIRASAVCRTTIGAGTVTTCLIARSPITRAPLRGTTIRHTIGARASTIAGAIAAWRVSGAVRPQFVFRQLAVAILIEFFERLARRLNFLGRQDAVVVGIERLEEGTAQRRRGAITAELAPRAAARPARGLSIRRGCHENKKSNADYAAEMASHDGISQVDRKAQGRNRGTFIAPREWEM